MKENPGHFGVMVVGMRYKVTLKQAAGLTMEQSDVLCLTIEG
jgi:hypothetical protein